MEESNFYCSENTYLFVHWLIWLGKKPDYVPKTQLIRWTYHMKPFWSIQVNFLGVTFK